ncbi:MAG: hypothetical protein H7068_03190 [Pedobacter sp.]|nr:hypothetical protein [Chitinophagaceae bacterium]
MKNNINNTSSHYMEMESPIGFNNQSACLPLLLRYNIGHCLQSLRKFDDKICDIQSDFSDAYYLGGKSTQIDPLPPRETDPLRPFQIDPLIPAQIDPLK